MAAAEVAPEPHIAAGAPTPVELEAGKDYYWCRCGLSKKQPFCDGSHKGTTFTPLKFTAEKTGTAYLCACKHTKKAPFCDGSHKSSDVLAKYVTQLLKANTLLREEVDTLKAAKH